MKPKTEENESDADAEQLCEVGVLHAQSENEEGAESEIGDYVEDVLINPGIDGAAEEADVPPEHEDTMLKETEIPDTIPDAAIQTEKTSPVGETKTHEDNHQTDATPMTPPAAVPEPDKSETEQHNMGMGGQEELSNTQIAHAETQAAPILAGEDIKKVVDGIDGVVNDAMNNDQQEKADADAQAQQEKADAQAHANADTVIDKTEAEEEMTEEGAQKGADGAEEPCEDTVPLVSPSGFGSLKARLQTRVDRKPMTILEAFHAGAAGAAEKEIDIQPEDKESEESDNAEAEAEQDDQTSRDGKERGRSKEKKNKDEKEKKDKKNKKDRKDKKEKKDKNKTKKDKKEKAEKEKEVKEAKKDRKARQMPETRDGAQDQTQNVASMTRQRRLRRPIRTKVPNASMRTRRRVRRLRLRSPKRKPNQVPKSRQRQLQSLQLKSYLAAVLGPTRTRTGTWWTRKDQCRRCCGGRYFLRILVFVLRSLFYFGLPTNIDQ